MVVIKVSKKIKGKIKKEYHKKKSIINMLKKLKK